MTLPPIILRKKMKQQRCLSCDNIITWRDMLKPTLENYNKGIIRCSHCSERYTFNRYGIGISRLLIYVPLARSLVNNN